MSDNTLGLSDEVPPSQAMILLPDNSEVGTEHCQAEMPEEQQGGKDDTNDSKKLYRAGTEDTLSVVGRRGCSHDKRGFCSTHGCLGVKKTRLIPCVMKNADGVKFKSTKKKYYYECEMGPRGQGVLRQTRLSFSRTPSLSSRNGDGHDRGGVNSFQFSSSTVGQHARGATQTAVQNSDGDEKYLDVLTGAQADSTSQ